MAERRKEEEEVADGAVLPMPADVPLEGQNMVLQVPDNDDLSRAQKKTRRIYTVAIVSAVVLLAVIVGLAVGLATRGGGGGSTNKAASNPTNANTPTMAPSSTIPIPTLSPTFLPVETPRPTTRAPITPTPTQTEAAQLDVLKAWLQDNGISSAVALADPTSPQHLAAEFMVSDSDSQPIPPDLATSSGQEFVDRYVLSVLFYSTGGPGWTNPLRFLWSTFSTCGWRVGLPNGPDTLGASCNTEMRVATIRIENNNLNGTIPSELGLLTELEYLGLRLGALRGVIPDALRRLTKLTHLSLYNNALSGALPEWFGELGQLQELALGNNMLEGTLPQVLGRFSDQMTLLAVDDNLLYGDIQVLNQLTKLQTLYLEKNDFQDTIDGTTFQGFARLAQLDISNNRFNGTLPVEWFDLTNLAGLKILDLHANQIAGSIPELIPDNNKLQVLAAHRNLLNGTIPESMGNFRDLDYVDFTLNPLFGTIPDLFGSYTRLEYLMLAGIPFEPGPIPESFRNISTLRDLSLKATQRTGTLPTWLGELPRLILLDLDSNDFNGTIPTELGDILSLNFLLLNRNNLNGQVPATLDGAGTLQLLMIEANSITGTVEFLCSNQLTTYADCGGPVPEVPNCTCCVCCIDGTPCHESDFLATYNPSDDTDYFRNTYQFVDLNITR